MPRPPRSTLFPYTTLFRSERKRPRFLLRLVSSLEILLGGFLRGQFDGGKRADCDLLLREHRDRKSTRLNSSHSQISYAVFCLKKKNALEAQHRDKCPRTGA